jgi:peptidoglycan LD-endopeptidase CwlK
LTDGEDSVLVIFWVALYFVLVLAALAWWFVPGVREFTERGTAAAMSRARRAAGIFQRSGEPDRSAERGGSFAEMRGGLVAAAGTLREHRLWLLTGLTLIVLVPAIALLVRHFWRFDGFDHRQGRAENPQVAALLRGEQLVPPAPLPPELFLTREVERARPMTADANRQWELLDADFRQRLLAVFKRMREQHGLEMVLIEGYRSPQRQAQLAGFGRAVTLAGPEESWHQFGLAADCAFLFDGKIVISETDPRAAAGYALYGEMAKLFGLQWGGAWRSIKDLGHVELRVQGVMQKSGQPSPPGT